MVLMILQSGPEKQIDWILAKGNVLTKTIEIVNFYKKGANSQVIIILLF